MRAAKDPVVQPRVIVFALGGTIAFDGAEHAGRRAGFNRDAVELTGSLGDQVPGVSIDPITFRACPSADLSLADISQLAAEIAAALAGGATGAVVTLGTDTLEEVAYALDCLVASEAPVVVTGAMRNPSQPGADGPANLAAAVAVAASPLAAGLGSLVVMNDEVHAARFAQKAHSSSPAAFRSPGAGRIGWISEGRVRIPLRPRRRTAHVRMERGAEVPPVALVRLGLGGGAELLNAVAADSSVAGVVLEALGAGHVPRALAEPLGELAGRVPVVFASRTGAGELYAHTASYPGSEDDLLKRGLIPAGALDGLKARVLLALLLAAGADRTEIRARLGETTS